MFGFREEKAAEEESEKMIPAKLARFFSDNAEMTNEIRRYLNIHAAMESGFNKTTGDSEDAKQLAESKERIQSIILENKKVIDGSIEEFITEVVYRISN